MLSDHHCIPEKHISHGRNLQIFPEAPPLHPGTERANVNESSIYVGEKGNNQVVELNIRSDSVVPTVNSNGEGMSRFFCPSSIRLSADGCFLLLLE